jgi:alkaline phosphatase D
MKRREFIRLGGFLTASVAAMSMTGCDIVGDNDNTSASAEDTTSYPNPSRPMPAASTTGNWYFPQSVASADPRDESIILWTRVLNNALSATDEAAVDVAVTLQVSSNPANGASLGSSTALTDSDVADLLVPAYVDFDGTVRHKLSGLAADTVYYYQFTVGTVRSKVGRFKTAPVATDTRDIKFAFMSCQDWSANHWGAFTQIVNDDIASPANLDFVVHLGDYIYETDNVNVAGAEALHGAQTFPTGADLPPERTTGALLPADPPGKYATTTSDYRYLYKLYRSDARIQAMHERFPMVAVWDDHEFSDDAWQNSETYTNRNLPQTERRRNANQAWFEFMPADVQFQEVNPSFQNIKLYRDLRFGANVHLVMTDERLYKQDHLIPEDAYSSDAAEAAGVQLGRINSRYLTPESSMKLAEQIKDATAPNMSLITILGQTQRDWWKSKMENSDATWKVWGNEVSLLRMSLNGTDAIATLVSLGFVAGLVTQIEGASAGTGGSRPIAAAAVGAGAFGASAATAGAAAGAIHAQLGNGTAAMVGAGVGAGLSVTQATVAVTGYLAAYSVLAAAGSTTAQSTTAAQAIAIGAGPYFGASDVNPSIRNDIRTNKDVSPFFIAAMAAADTAGSLPAGTTAGKVKAFLRKFVINADQWDGYRMERTNLMNFLLNKGISNVVAITGDIHAFFAGKVYNEFAGEVLTVDAEGAELTASAGGTAAMVDLVTAGISSTSWFNYIKAAADGLDPTNSLIGKLVYVPVDISAAFGQPANTVKVNLNLLDYTLGRPAPANAAALAAQLDDQIKRIAAAYGTPEGSLEATSAGVQAAVAGSASFASALGLAQMLAALGAATNPWLNSGHVSAEAQGYAVVTASPTDLKCDFVKLNPIVATTAPSAARLRVGIKRATITAGSTDIVMSDVPLV